VTVVTSLSSADLRGALVAAGEWHEAATLPELAAAAVTSLHELVPCEGVGWNEVDLLRGEVRAVTSPVEYFDQDQVATLNRLIDQHPIVRYVAETGDESATKISDFVSARQFHALELYTDFFRPLGAEDLLAVVFQSQPVIVGIAFTRDRRSYRERDRDLLNLVRPHLAGAYRNVATRIEAQERISALERGLEGRHVVPLTPTGRLAQRSQLLERWFGNESPAPGSYEREDARLVIRRVEGDPPLLLVDEQRFGLTPELGLSAREAQVLALAARGLTDAQIADQLFLSTRTVSKHLQHAYEKLDVHSRADAIARLLRG
jgi:DNA-binding CsgD family transcriptional regulator